MVSDAHHIINDWIKTHSDTFFDYVYKRVHDKAIVKDILQETFISAWKNSHTFKKEADEKTWLFAILKNKVIDYYRTQAKLKTDFHDSSYFFDNEDHWTENGGPKQWQDAAAALNQKEFYSVLDQCLSLIHI